MIKNTCGLTWVSFITQDKMPRYTFIWKQIVYKQNETHNYLGEKGKEIIMIIKSLIYARIGRGALRGAL